MSFPWHFCWCSKQPTYVCVRFKDCIDIGIVEIDHYIEEHFEISIHAFDSRFIDFFDSFRVWHFSISDIFHR